ncbi:polysaccharide deacetylase family protein [Lichenihabitans psoromatis]|uniref:polysaccharide deacetylase family protein n=1 Tax=Lichenihabitans psoromatis TaxID=2528642 RepID=UPI00103858E4|nr:polysaccharide deacetylase family protein [Lichenihabitans psoromatis]
MMISGQSDDPWIAVREALDRTADDGGTTRLWLRDDDAIAVTPALNRLGDLSGSHSMPVLLAVIPAGATAQLAAWVAERRWVTPCQHGWAHTNHARPGERACELGGDRPDEVVLADLADGRRALHDLFGSGSADTLVPPWNRIRPSVLPALPQAGYRTLSTFDRPTPGGVDGLKLLNCDLDLIDWRNGRRGRSIPDLCGRLVRAIDAARLHRGPIGLLSHHLAHDEAAWDFLEQFLDEVRPSPAVSFIAVAAAD